ELARVGVRPLAFHQRRWQDGRTLARSRLRDETEALWRAPAYVFHRGELNAVLTQALPKERVHLSHRCSGFTEHDDHVEARCENGVTIKDEGPIGGDGHLSNIA